MEDYPIYWQIVESIRQQVLTGVLQPGDRIPPVRQMTSQWNCTQGTVLRAYQELARQGLVISHVGQGTRVADSLPIDAEKSLRRAALVNRCEAFLLDILTIGYTPEDVDEGMRLALDHWRTLSVPPPAVQEGVYRFAGSHDPAISIIAAQFPGFAPGYNLQITFSGSLSGLMSLAEGKAEIAGSHLWDEETDTYNTPFIRRLFPGHPVALLTLAHRRVGLLLPPGNPRKLKCLEDLGQSGVRFVNRQPGSGTRVWLDAQLRQRKIDPHQIEGFEQELPTHSEVARAVAEKRADVGLGIQTAALSFELDFEFLTTERYDLAVPAEGWTASPTKALQEWLCSPKAKSILKKMGGYDTSETGKVTWVE
jgi:molybdate-binding protein/DNA-binding transcriptional regulator YhcF (GntR family)